MENKVKKQSYFDLRYHRGSMALGNTSGHEACMKCVQEALSYRKNCYVYYVVWDENKEEDYIISETLVFSYEIEKVDAAEVERRTFELTTEH